MIGRRAVLASLAMVVAWPALAQSRTARLGVLTVLAEHDPETRLRTRALEEKLQALGWSNGANLHIDYRFAGGDAGKLTVHAADLLRSGPNVVLAHSNPGLKAVLEITRAVPVVFIAVSDPVDSGFVESMARPGGNATGFSNFDPAIGGKWLETLHEIAPGVRHATVIMHKETAAHAAMLRAAEAAAPALGITVASAGIQNGPDIERVIAALAESTDAGLIVLPHIITAAHRVMISDLAARHRLPAVYAFRHHATSGGLLSYGIDVVDLFTRAATYIDLILRGAKPGQLPVQAPTKYELVINLRTAKLLDLAVPPSLLARADEVLE